MANIFVFFNNIIVESVAKCDTSWLSETDKECLNYAIDMCKDLNFNELTNLSHDKDWSGAWPGKKITISDMLREKSETEEYIEYVNELSIKLS